MYRVMVANTKELIEMQTRNDSTDPRSGLSFYEKYHSLEDVGPATLIHPKTLHTTACQLKDTVGAIGVVYQNASWDVFCWATLRHFESTKESRGVVL